MKPACEERVSCWGAGFGCLGLAGSTKMTHPSRNLAFISCRAFSASSLVAYLTKPKPFDLPETLSVTTFAAQSNKSTLQLGVRKRMNRVVPSTWKKALYLQGASQKGRTRPGASHLLLALKGLRQIESSRDYEPNSNSFLGKHKSENKLAAAYWVWWQTTIWMEQVYFYSDKKEFNKNAQVQ